MLRRRRTGKAARFPQIKTLDDFDFSFQHSIDRRTIAHLGQLDFLHEAKNVVFLGPPGTGKTHLSIALGVQAARRGHRVAFATAHDWVQRLAAVNLAGKLDHELERLGRSIPTPPRCRRSQPCGGEQGVTAPRGAFAPSTR